MAQLPVSSFLRRNGGNLGDPLRLADSFIVSEEECVVLDDRPADSSPKLVPLEGRNLAHIEIVQRVELAVAEKLVTAAMNLIRSRTRDRVDHAAGGFSIIRLIVAGQYGEFLDCIDPQVSSQHAARCTVGVIVEA